LKIENCSRLDAQNSQQKNKLINNNNLTQTLMKKFLSLIVVLMLAFGVKAQTAPDFNCIDDYGKKVHLYDILDNNHYAFLYFFIPDTEDQEGQFSQIIAETYYNYGANQDEVYFIGIAPTGDSLSVDWWKVDYQVDFPIIHKFTEGSDVHDICDAYGVQFLARLILVAPDHQIIINDLWPVNSTQHLISEIDAAIVEHKKSVGVAELENNYTIYPNPASSEVKIISNGDANVKIFDMTGRCVKDINVTEDATIDIKDLNTGVYFVNVNGKVEKLVVK
jgi:hypothetical protein